ncbi:type II toxin-antitoxin system HicA family toxin [Fodinisporobacter ferrooxydans]|uniref:Type II toxin-antitoxin system HicA family toxin n=1 Tax=Fodinisporobacter ferrooxydans TaxID=2901836 RepID=A0ABY4CKJ8_9BACL|nr:type II toxin-antitoxin system HicA family toxin [Alicyclobacillaceae bacterium MYW30-H2]
MSQFEKLLQKIKNNPKQVSFEELEKILRRLGFEVRQPRGGSSHYVFLKGPKQISIPKHGKHVKVIYVEQVIETLKEEGVM